MVKLYKYCRVCRRYAKFEITDEEINEKEDSLSLILEKKDSEHSIKLDCICEDKTFTIGSLPYAHLIHLLKCYPELIGLCKKFDSIEKIFPVYFNITLEELQKVEEENKKKICIEIEDKIKLLQEELTIYKKT